MELTSLYLHIPFCIRRCSYCDFNTYAGRESVIPQYIDALCREVNWLSGSIEERFPVHTIYLGGGTPSLLSLYQVEIIMQAIRSGFNLQSDVEITIEANPGSLSREYLYGIREVGVNRLSIGMQSAHDFELNLLGRIHSYTEVVKSMTWARQAGFKNVNLDLIYGLPGQSIQDWQRSLQLAIGLSPEHLSLYSLTLDDEVPMARWVARGMIEEQDFDLAADMYELAGDLLEQAGYESYEISNWARCDRASNLLMCQHNLQYWRGNPYLGIGAGAHGYINHVRTVNELIPETYINRMSSEIEAEGFIFPISPANIEYRILNQADEMGEYMMMGLRLTQEGVKEKKFQERFKQSLEIKYSSQIKRLIHLQLLEWINGSDRRLRLTKRGRLLGNQVFCEFI